MKSLVLALDTATEVTAVGLAWRDASGVRPFADAVEDTPRAAMSHVLPSVASLLSANGLATRDISAVVVGAGPGSFTGVRIGVATAKGLAHGLGAPLYGVGTLDAVAWPFANDEALLGVLGDAMRGEVYPALFRCAGGSVERLTQDRVAKPLEAAREWAKLGEPLLLAGNGLRKYGALFAETIGSAATIASERYWAPGAAGLFAAFEQQIRAGTLGDGDPAAVLPVYTRLSDAEEAEAARAGRTSGAPPASGVAGVPGTSGGAGAEAAQ